MAKNYQVEVLVNCKNTLGESPVLYNGKLYWVDIIEEKIYCYDFESTQHRFWVLPEMVGFIVFKGDQLIAGLQTGLFQIELKEDGSTFLTRIYRLESNGKNIRFNDGTIDKEGNIWCCTMDMDSQENIGNYYLFDSSFNATVIDQGYIVANSPAVSKELHLLYTVETIGNDQLKRGVYVASLKGNQENEKKLLINWDIYNSYPDGIQVDALGNLWVGEFGGNRLKAFTKQGELLYDISLPAMNITKAVLAYEKGVIFVTTALLGVDEKALSDFPYTGAVLKIITT